MGAYSSEVPQCSKPSAALRDKSSLSFQNRGLTIRQDARLRSGLGRYAVNRSSKAASASSTTDAPQPYDVPSPSGRSTFAAPATDRLSIG